MRLPLLVLSSLLIVPGCSDEMPDDTEANTPSARSTVAATAETAAQEAKPEAQHVATFTHQFPQPKEEGNGASSGITPVPVPGQPFYGFNDLNHSSETEYLGKAKILDFQMKLLDHRDGKDVYEITRVVAIRTTEGSVTSETTGVPTTVTVEFGGEELTVFDDEHGIASFVPQATTGDQN